MQKIYLILILSALTISSESYASKPVSRDCGMVEQITLSINYNMNAESFAIAKTVFDTKLKQVQDFAKKQGVKKFELQNMNFSVNSNNYGNGSSGVQLNGSAGYLMDNADAAFKLAEFLETQKMNVNVNASKYKNGNCNNLTE